MHPNYVLVSNFPNRYPLFKLICNQIEDFHGKVKFLSNYNKFWVLQNCVPIIDTLNKVDFSRLYIKLLHNKLQGKAFWCKKVKGCIEFTSNSTGLKLQSNTNWKLLSHCWEPHTKKDIKILMGIDPAPFWTNLFLYIYENQFMTKLNSNNKIKGWHFHSTNWFIDYFGCTNSEIYPKELELKPKNQGTNVSFLNFILI